MEKVGTYWIEVVGLDEWLEGAGKGGGIYLGFMDAYNAASKGIEFWDCYMAGRPIDMYGGKYYWKGDEIPEFTPPEYKG